LEAALKSALEQTLKAIEVIVIDDRSTDSSCAIVEQLAARDGRLRLITATKNGGPSAARNRGLQAARGEWVCILDADDLFAPNRLAALLERAIQAHADLIADNLIVFYDDRSMPPHHFLKDIKGAIEIDVLKYLDETTMYGGGADFGFLKPLIRKNFLVNSSLKYDEALRIGEDDDLILKMLLEGARYLVCDDALYGYRKHSASISHRLPSGPARALESSARALEHAMQETPWAVRLQRRRKAITKARAFAEFIDALKQRDIFSFLKRAASNPAAVPLLRMPVVAALRRGIMLVQDSANTMHGVNHDLISNWRELTEVNP